MASSCDRETLRMKIEDSEHCRYEDAALESGIEKGHLERSSRTRDMMQRWPSSPLSDDNFGNYVFAFRFEPRVFVSA